MGFKIKNNEEVQLSEVLDYETQEGIINSNIGRKGNAYCIMIPFEFYEEGIDEGGFKLQISCKISEYAYGIGVLTKKEYLKIIKRTAIKMTESKI